MNNEEILELDDEIIVNIAVDTPSPTGLSITDLSPQVEAHSSKTGRWAKLASIKIENFKVIESTEVPLADVTILVGPNGSGKSSVLQAIHWAARAASYIPPRIQKSAISFDRLDYLPSSDPLKTAYKSELLSDTKSDPTRITFKHLTNDADAADVVISIWAARNKGGISPRIEGSNATTPFKQRQEFITAYIPGLAGLSEKETILAQPLLRRQAASGDAGSVLRNVLLNLASRLSGEEDDSKAVQRLTRLNELIQWVHPQFSIAVTFDDREDVNIQAFFVDEVLSGNPRPLETAATGVLQVVQIFAYLVLFKPKILLIDEPDAHLHPDKQERLIEALERAAVEFETQILITTHSPHIVRAATPLARLVWMNKGKCKNTDRTDEEKIRQLMGWGALDKKIIFFIEDEDDAPIRAILRQWPRLLQQISICRCFGIDNLPKNKLLEGLMQEGDILMKALIHRDRDFMTDEECLQWSRLYTSSQASVWCTPFVDVESYFCQSDYLAALYNVSPEVADDWINCAVKKVNGAKDTFFEKRRKIINALHKDGGGPNTKELWEAAGGITKETVLGKLLLKALKPIIKQAGHDDKRLDNLVIPQGFTLALDLKSALEEALSSPSGT